MAKNENQEEQEGQEPKKKKGKIKWILLGVIILGLGAGGYFGYQYFLANDSGKSKGNATKAESGTGENGKKSKTQMVSLPSMIVNLADPLGRRYLKVSMDVQVVNKQASKKLQDSMPKVKDALLMLLSSKSYSDVDSMEEKLKLKNEVVSRLNQIVGESPVVKVYFTEFVVQ